MVLTSSDIGTNPETVEANLTRNFKTAKSWGAVLLIDEADVYMERREAADLQRNILVAGWCSVVRTNLSQADSRGRFPQSARVLRWDPVLDYQSNWSLRCMRPNTSLTLDQH